MYTNVLYKCFEYINVIFNGLFLIKKDYIELNFQ